MAISQHRDSIDGRRKKRPGIDEQREVISRAAVQLFSEHGAKTVSIAQICKQADVSRPTFYRCFADKESLVEKIYEEAVDIHIKPVLLQSSLKNPKQLRANLTAMLEAIFDRREFAQLIFAEASDPGSPAGDIVERAFDRAAQILARDIRKVQGEAPSKVYLKSVMSAVQWIAHDAIRKGLTAKARREAEEAAYQLVIRALAQGQ